jgi:hypothetical protein
MATSVFNTIAQDYSILTGAARAMDLTPETRTGRVLSYDNFEDGFGRWADHYSGRPFPPISLTAERALSSKRSLMLGSVTPPSGASSYFGQNTSTYNRMSRTFTERFVDFSCWFSIGGSDALASSSWYMYLDTQAWDNTWRSFFRVQCGVSSTTGKRRWQIADNSGAYVAVPSAGLSNPTVTGWNEGKMNANYVRVTIDMTANAGHGGYYQLQVNDRTFSLSALGAGSGDYPPQVGSGENDSFSGGFNPGFGMGSLFYGDANAVQFGKATLVLDEIVVSVRN